MIMIMVMIMVMVMVMVMIMVVVRITEFSGAPLLSRVRDLGEVRRQTPLPFPTAPRREKDFRAFLQQPIGIGVPDDPKAKKFQPLRIDPPETEKLKKKILKKRGNIFKKSLDKPRKLCYNNQR